MIRPIYVDVETVPMGAAEHREELRRKGLLERWQEWPPPCAYEGAKPARRTANALEHWRSWSALPSRAEVVTTAWAVGSGSVLAAHYDAGKTIAMLAADTDATHIVGWNVSYDCAVLMCSALRNGLAHTAAAFAEPHYRVRAQFRLYGGMQQLDAMDLWHQVRGKGEGKLETACRVMGIERPENPIDGSQVLDAYMADRDDEILAHNRADVRDLREVFTVLCAMHGIKIEEGW